MKTLSRIIVLMLFFQVVPAQEVDDGDPLLNRPAERTYDITVSYTHLTLPTNSLV